MIYYSFLTGMKKTGLKNKQMFFFLILVLCFLGKIIFCSEFQFLSYVFFLVCFCHANPFLQTVNSIIHSFVQCIYIIQCNT